MTNGRRICGKGGDCDSGTLVTAPDCFDYRLQCVEKCDTCDQYDTDDAAAFAVADRLHTHRTYCGRYPGCYHWVIDEGVIT